MLDDDIATVPAGWYPDPMGLPQLRWWDNYAWTEFTSAARTPLIMQDEPKLAYADDDLPSRRSQREQQARAEQGGARQATGNPADLAFTLRQLEPPKPQNVERSQPAPTIADIPAASAPQEARFTPEPTPAPAPVPEPPRVAEPVATAPASGPAYDPFAEFLNTPAPQQEESTRSQPKPRFGEQLPFEEHAVYGEQNFAGSDYGQPQPAAGNVQQPDFGRDQFGRGSGAREQNGRGQYDYGQSRIGIHAPLTNTPFVWIIALIPLIQLVGLLLVVSAVEVSIAMPFLASIAIGPYIASIPLAIADHHHLLKMGQQQPAHWAWSLLTAPAYLVARAIAASREYGKGLTPLLVWAALSLLQVVSLIAVPGILISAMPTVFSAEVEQSLEADSIIQGAKLEVECPPTPPVQIGGTFNCTGVMVSTGDTVGIVVRLQRANGWIDWRVYGMVWDKDQPNATQPVTEGEAPAEG